MTNKFIAVGCSHTAGIGVNPGEIYVDLLGKELNLQCDNRSIAGSNSSECLYRLVDALREYRPKFIVAQWPNIYRKTLWINDKKIFQNINNADESFDILLKHCSKNFIEPWIENILIADTLARLGEIDIFHIYLDETSKAIEELSSRSIKIHCDEKKSGSSWIFDNAGSDGLHHSSQCHYLWSRRLLGIINEHST